MNSLKAIGRKAYTALTQLKRGNVNYVVARAVTHLNKYFHHPWLTLPFNLHPRSRVQQNFDPMAAPAYMFNTSKLSFPRIRAAVILDDFSLHCWQQEFNTIVITVDNWRHQLEQTNVDVLFVESAHSGNHGEWRGKIKSTGSPDAELASVVDWCKNRGIPTVFWNKEDPVHFDEFLQTALLFDVIFTTDANMIPKYESFVNTATVAVMPFAAQPKIHNPANNSPTMPGIRDPRIRRGDIAFAGTYFTEKYAERRRQLDVLLKGAIKVAQDNRASLTIFSRQNELDKRYRFPSHFRSYVVGSLSPDRMLSANKEHKVFLNVNSVTDSATMCARRLFELPACGAAVVSAYSPAVSNFFAEDEISIARSAEDAAAKIKTLVNSPEVRDRMVHKAQRTIWNRHCYHHRAQLLFDAIKLQDDSATFSPTISVICSSNRPNNIEHLLSQYSRQINVDRELVLITHGYELDDSERERLFEAYGISAKEVIIDSSPKDETLGACLNKAVSYARGQYIAKFDDDDIYLPHYLEDMRNTAAFSGADLIGKQACYAYIQQYDALVLRNPECEHLWGNFVAGPTLFGPIATFKQTPFQPRNTGEDTAFINTVKRRGGSIYCSDRFNFIQVRSSGHTWRISDEDFIAQGQVRTFGLHEKHVIA